MFTAATSCNSGPNLLIPCCFTACHLMMMSDPGSAIQTLILALQIRPGKNIGHGSKITIFFFKGLRQLECHFPSSLTCLNPLPFQQEIFVHSSATFEL
jgi:hypothetical protein